MPLLLPLPVSGRSCYSAFFATPDAYSRRVIESKSGSTSTTPTTSQFAQLMEAIGASQERMDSKLAGFRDELQKSQEDAASKALKWVRHERPYSFCCKGNEEQATFNEWVESTTHQHAHRPHAGSFHTVFCCLVFGDISLLSA